MHQTQRSRYLIGFVHDLVGEYHYKVKFVILQACSNRTDRKFCKQIFPLKSLTVDRIESKQKRLNSPHAALLPDKAFDGLTIESPQVDLIGHCLQSKNKRSLCLAILAEYSIGFVKGPGSSYDSAWNVTLLEATTMPIVSGQLKKKTYKMRMKEVLFYRAFRHLRIFNDNWGIIRTTVEGECGFRN
jgi:hypothetical protein